MKYTDIPSKVPLPFASSGSKNTIPTDSQIGITPGAASLTDGFPPLTFTPVAAGGIPPSGKDFNGLFNLLSANTRWANAGGFYKYDATFSTAVGGYPNGAVLLRADNAGLWVSTADDNTSDPDSGGANWTGVPFGTGAKIISANTTLTVADAGLIEIDASAGNVTVTLESAAALAGLQFTFARSDTSSNTVTIAAGGTDTIEGSTSMTLLVSDRLTILSDGSSIWRYAGAQRAGDSSQTFSVADATQAHEAVALGQLTAPIGAFKSVNGTNTTLSASVSFTAPSAGLLFAVGTRNVSDSSGGSYTVTLDINGTQQETDSTRLSTTHSAAVTTTGGPVSAKYTAVSNIQFAVTCSLIFIPTV